VYKYGIHPICDGKIRRGKKERRRKIEESTGQNIMPASATQSGEKKKPQDENIMACPIP